MVTRREGSREQAGPEGHTVGHPSDWGRWARSGNVMARAATVGSSGGFAGLNDREIDVGRENLVEIVGPGVQGDVLNDLDHLRIAVAGAAERPR